MTRTPQQQALDEALTLGVSESDNDMMRLALEKGAAPDLLVTASYDKGSLGKLDPALLTLALQKGADANLMLFGGIGKQSLAVVKLAVEQGSADVNAVCAAPGASETYPAAHWVYRSFDAGVSDYLTDKGMAVDTPDKAGNTPLLLAVEADDYTRTMHYLGHSANPMIANAKGAFPMKTLEDLQSYSSYRSSELYENKNAVLKEMLKNVPDDNAPAPSARASDFNTVATKDDIEVSHPIELKKAPAAPSSGKGFTL